MTDIEDMNLEQLKKECEVCAVNNCFKRVYAPDMQQEYNEFKISQFKRGERNNAQ